MAEAALPSISVEFPQGGSPAPAFASFCTVHRMPGYVLVDLGSLDPLSMEPNPNGGTRALLQHVGRLAMPDETARRLAKDLLAQLGEATGSG